MLFLCDCSIRCHILVDVGDGVAGALDIGGGKGNAVGVGGEYALGVHGKVADQARFLYFLKGSIAHALVYHGADHFPMGHFFRADVVAGSLYTVIRHGETLGEVAAGRCQLRVSQRRAYFLKRWIFRSKRPDILFNGARM